VVFTSLSLLLSLSCAGDVKSRSCSDVRQAFTTKGFSLHNVPHQEIQGEDKVPHHKFLLTCQLVENLRSAGEQLVLVLVQQVCLLIM